MAALPFACGDDAPWDDGAIRVTPNGLGVADFDWSEDGLIVGTYSGYLYVIDSESGRYREIDGKRGFAVTEGVCWSPDAKYIAFGGRESYGVTNIYVIPRNAVSVDEGRKLTERGGSLPAWSPDGKSIAYSSLEGVSLVPAEGGEPKVEVPEGVNPAWSPSGKYIAYVKEIGGNLHLTEIFVKRVGEETERRLSYFGLFVWAPDWSPDGRFIAFPVKDVKGEGRKNDIWAVPAKAGEPIKVTDEPGTNYRGTIGADGPRWTPDGKWIAFYSPRGEHIGQGVSPAIWKVRFKRY